MIAALTRYLGVTPKTLRIFLTISLSACIYWFLSIKTVTYEPFRAALGVTNTELGTLLGITGFVQVFGYITLGWLQDMLQIRGIIMIDLIVYALLALSLALLPTPPFWWLCVVYRKSGLKEHKRVGGDGDVCGISCKGGQSCGPYDGGTQRGQYDARAGTRPFSCNLMHLRRLL